MTVRWSPPSMLQLESAGVLQDPHLAKAVLENFLDKLKTLSVENGSMQDELSIKCAYIDDMEVKLIEQRVRAEQSERLLAVFCQEERNSQIHNLRVMSSNVEQNIANRFEALEARFVELRSSIQGVSGDIKDLVRKTTASQTNSCQLGELCKDLNDERTNLRKRLEQATDRSVRESSSACGSGCPYAVFRTSAVEDHPHFQRNTYQTATFPRCHPTSDAAAERSNSRRGIAGSCMFLNNMPNSDSLNANAPQPQAGDVLPESSPSIERYPLNATVELTPQHTRRKGLRKIFRRKH